MLIPIICDELVDMEFGTGAVKIAPAHGHVDNEIAKHHNTPLIEVINENGLTKNSEIFNNMKRYECREAVVQALVDMKLLREVLPHQMTLRLCSLTGDVIYYLPKEQWYLSCSQFNKKAGDLVRTGSLQLIPERFVGNWLELTGEDRDWCLSRQLWWGHQIPMYKCTAGQNSVWIAAADENAARMQAFIFLESVPNLINITRDNDVLDSWFSSAVYPFAVLGWPNSNKRRSFKEHYPLNVVTVGHDILGLWVHRMVILSLALTEKLPFNKILLHGAVCDSDGAKICKSRGNTIDPDDIIFGVPLDALKYKHEDMYKAGLLSKDELDKALDYCKANFAHTDGIPRCGADALRFTLLSQDLKSESLNFDMATCYHNKVFCDKIWQSLIEGQICYGKLKKLDDEEVTVKDLTYFDKWILSRLADMVNKVNSSMENYDYHLATAALRSFIQDEFCDVYLQAIKSGFEDDNPKIGYAHAHTLSAVLNTSLRCLAPFMVYLPEELLPRVPGFKSNIIYNFKDASSECLIFPKYTDFEIWKDDAAEQRVGELLSAIKIVMNIKGLYNITNELIPCVYINTAEKNLKSDILNNKNIVLNLTQCTDVKFEKPPTKNIIKTTLGQDTEIVVALQKEEARQVIAMARNKLEKRIKRVEIILSNLESKYASKEYLQTTTLCVQLSDRETLKKKRKKLQDLQKLL